MGTDEGSPEMAEPLWPICRKCHRSIEVHYLRGNIAFCDDTKRGGMRSTFKVAEINRLRRALGHTVTAHARDLERLEAGEGMGRPDPFPS